MSLPAEHDKRSLYIKIHEYQAKEILARYGVPVPRGRMATTPEQAADIARELGGRAVVKAQVHAGGRGKAGGIRIVLSPEEAATAAEAMIGTRLVTFQTGPDGIPVHSVLIEEAVEVLSELYVGMTVDGATEGVVVIASAAGGVAIEEVAETSPKSILRVALDPVLGLQHFQARRLAYDMSLTPELIRPIWPVLDGLYRAFVDNDFSLVEVNPLGTTADGRLLAMDAKIVLDDDALFRHTNLAVLRDPEQVDALELEADEHNINYVKLLGDVGCIVNGAGLAMATMDVTTAAGTAPANFLDIGGGADEAKVAKALTIVMSDPDVKRVLINIFGGILRCDVAARGFMMAADQMPDAVRPMVIRMQGTNAAEGRSLLAGSDLNVTLVDDLNGAADAIRALG